MLLGITRGERPRFAYSADGYDWTPAGPAPHGGSLLRAPDGTFYLAWSSGARADKGFSYASSKDPLQWGAPQKIEIMATQNALDVVDPHLYWDAAASQFIVTWASTMAANSIQAFQEEVDNNPRIFYATTRDFQTFSEPALLFDPNYSVKDAVLLKDGNRFVLLHNDNTIPMQELRVAFGTNPLGPWGPSRDAFTDKFIQEPAAIQLRGEWWIYAANTKTGAGGLMKTRDFWSFTEAGAVHLPNGLATVLEVPRSVLDRLLKGR